MAESNIPVSESHIIQMENSDLLSQLCNPVPSLATLLKEGRKRNNLKQYELAQLTNLTTAEISRIESGSTKKPCKKVLKALAPYIGLPFSQLLLYSGYNGIDEEEIYYNKQGEIIDYRCIINNIYKADPELLESLQNINEFPKQDIQMIKKIIDLSKKMLYNSRETKKNSITEKIIHSLKRYILEQLDLISNI